MSAEKNKTDIKCNIQNHIKKSIYRSPVGVTGFILCMLLAGCHKADRAITLPVGEPLKAAEQEITGREAAEQATVPELKPESVPEPLVIYVYVCGAVKEPGVVRLPEGSRGQDALDAAGGFAEDAAKDAVNLAAVLTDGMKLYFPTPEESPEAEREAQDRDAGLIDINTAEVELLCTLPGIGETRARAIVAYREENGAFGSVEEIMQVSGIKDGAYNKIKALITVK